MVVEGWVVDVVDETVVVVDDSAVVVVVDDSAVVVVVEDGSVVVVVESDVVVVVDDSVVVVVVSLAAPAVPDGKSSETARVMLSARLPRSMAREEAASVTPPRFTLLPRIHQSAQRFAIGVKPYMTKRKPQGRNRELPPATRPRR